MTAEEMAALIAILEDAARAEIMPRFGRLTAADIREKTGPNDLVTVADEAAERAITAALRARFPGALVVGEEACAADPGLLARLPEAERAFVVDPIDGTYNYQAGVPLFGVMAAAIERGRIVAGAILDPVSGTTASARAGAGAWMSGARAGAARRLRVATPVPPRETLGCASWMWLPEPQRTRAIAGLGGLGGTWSYRCAAHEYRLAAAGHCHFLLYNKLMPWDHAPGWLLHREAGGHAVRFDGSDYTVATLTGGLLCAPDEASWVGLRDALL